MRISVGECSKLSRSERDCRRSQLGSRDALDDRDAALPGGNAGSRNERCTPRHRAVRWHHEAPPRLSGICKPPRLVTVACMVLSARLGSARLGTARLGTACTGHRASALGGADPSNPEGHQDAGFSTIDSKRIAPVTLSRRRKRKGWSMTIGSVLTGVAVAMTPIPVAAAAVVPFGVT